MQKFPHHRSCDVAIVGGGPAGLAAAVYLSRFLRTVVVFDGGDARAKLIPKTHNCPGFPEGIAGEALLGRLREQATAVGAEIVEGQVIGVERRDGRFVLITSSGATHASCMVLATGIVDRVPAIEGLRKAIADGSVRLCPVCDAYEARRLSIGVAGPEQPALKEALFLRSYSPQVCILANCLEDISEVTRIKAAAAGIEIWDNVVDLVPRSETGVDVLMGNGLPARRLAVLYAAMGCEVRSELAASLGAACDDEGYILVGKHLQTSIPGLYAVGDVAKALNQIAVGFGHAALAAAHIHGALRERDQVGRPEPRA